VTPERLNRASRQRTSWAYARTQYLERFYTEDQWTATNYKRRINDLTARITHGLSWLDTIPRSDPRHAKWAQKIVSLRAERALLQKRVSSLKLAEK
jgi:hypothetical protein